MNRTIFCLALLTTAGLHSSLAAAQLASVNAFGCVATGGTNCTSVIPDAPQPALTSTVVATGDLSCTNGIRSVQAAINLNHEWIGDLELILSSPNGAQATLISSLADASAVPGSCQADDIDATFATSGTAAACNASTIPALTGTVRSAVSLTPLAQGAINGTWTLSIQDLGNDNLGALNDWTLRVVCTPNIPLPGPNQNWLLLALLGMALLGSASVLRRS